MRHQIVECIANYSDARRPEVIEAISQAITSVEGVHLLDRHSDLDHNRTVLTFAGGPEAVEEAAFRSIAKAAELINLDEHQGEHPRLGATDVVPFVPIEGVTMEDCVQIALRLGKRVGEELSIPVYLYEQAATRPERQNLENIRRGQYEALKEEIASKPEREPDFGPKRVGPAGGIVIGARPPLIAFNVYLTTDDVTIADKIAKAVRHSSGGLRFVKGLGILVEGRAQVSMNLTNFKKTPVARVVETIRREAERYGVAIHHSELVGLIPQEALVEAAVWYMQLDQFSPEQILEQRLFSAMRQGDNPTEEAGGAEDFIQALAEGTPTPGGGSASAHAAAAGAALVAMMARLTIGKKKYAQAQERMQAILERAESLRADLSAAVTEDSAAFERLMAANRLPKERPEEERRKAVEAAVLGAARVPLQVAAQAAEVMELAFEAADLGNSNALTDAATGAALARAALTGAGMNVRINLKWLEDRAEAERFLQELQAAERRGTAAEEKLRHLLDQRESIPLL
jgi:glutamate formiminotransferase / formiminotetrahydrofolate cyclodeaminase